MVHSLKKLESMNREFFHKDFFAINQGHEASELPLKPFWSDATFGLRDVSQKDLHGGWVRGCRKRPFWLWVMSCLRPMPI